MSKESGTKEKKAPKRFATFADLGEQAIEVSLRTPKGETLKVKMRSISDEEMHTMRRIFPDPPQPVDKNDLKRSEPGGPVEHPLITEGPVYDAWVEEFERARSNYSNLLLLRSLVDLEVPGDTELEKVESLRTGKHVWASMQLRRAALDLNSVGEEEVSAAVANFPLPT